MEDSQILQHFFDRSEQAIADTAEAYGGYCASVARNILDTPEDVEEVLSDTWLRAWNTIPPEKPENLKLYLARITRNLSIDRFRARSREKRGGGETALALDELAQCLGTGETPEQQMEARELRTAVNRFLGSLPRRDRGIFLLRYFYLESAQTIARRYGLRPGNESPHNLPARTKVRAAFSSGRDFKNPASFLYSACIAIFRVKLYNSSILCRKKEKAL